MESIQSMQGLSLRNHETCSLVTQSKSLNTVHLHNSSKSAISESLILSHPFYLQFLEFISVLTGFSNADCLITLKS